VLDGAGEAIDNTDLKYTRWEDIADAFSPPLLGASRRSGHGGR